MTSQPAISVVVPTCGRPGSLRRLLEALMRQAEPPPFDVVVVTDGVAGNAVGIDARETWPFAVRVVAQAALGPAVARNRGASEARAPILLFMDDDIEPGPATIRAHVDFHASHPTTIGAGDLTPIAAARGFVGLVLAGWWERMNEGLRDPRHRFTFRDLLTGHCSMPRSLFEQVGRFDPAFRCHEDFEFGYRAIEAGVDLGFVTGGYASHHDATGLDGMLRRKVDEGRADVQLVAKHPRLLRALPLGRPLGGGRMGRLVHEAGLQPSLRSTAIERSLLASMRLFEAVSMRDKWREALERAMDYSYWRGARAGAGSASAVRALRARIDAPWAMPMLVDLAAGLDAAEAQVERDRPRALHLTLGDEMVGILPEQPGAEPLRGAHVRPILLKVFAEPFAAAAHRMGLLPPAFARAVSRLRREADDIGAPRQARVA